MAPTWVPATSPQGMRLLTDLYLIPGNHWLRVDGSIGDYTLTLTPARTARPERGAGTQQPGPQRRTVRRGRQPHRPSAHHPGRGRVPVHGGYRGPPPLHRDARQRTQRPACALESGSMRLGDIDGQQGVPTVYDAVIQPGDYELWLTTPGDPSRRPLHAGHRAPGPVPARSPTRSPTTP